MWNKSLTAKHRRHSPVFLLVVSALAACASLVTMLRVYAMPVEARTTEAWYSYQSSVGFDFTANVSQGRYYPRAQAQPADLLKVKGNTDPPVYRRVLISKATDSIEVRLPYRFKADRPTPLQATLKVEGMLTVPLTWQKPYPLLAGKEFTVQGDEIAGVETFVIPVARLLDDMDAMRQDLKVAVEPMELHIRPAFEVRAGGLREPVAVQNAPEFVISLRSSTIEIDEPKDARVEKNLAETRVVPITVAMFGKTVPVTVLRQISTYALILFLLLAAGLVWRRRKKPSSSNLLQKLGPNLLTVRSFEVPGEMAVAEVRSAREMLQLHAQTERPVIRVSNVYYLLDGTTCYRLTLQAEPAGDD